MVTDLATLLDHARLTDLERAILRAIVPMGYIGGTARELSDALDVNRSSLFRALSSLDRRGLVMRSSKRGKSGSMLVTLNGRAVDILRGLCDHLGREGERPGGGIHPGAQGRRRGRAHRPCAADDTEASAAGCGARQRAQSEQVT